MGASIEGSRESKCSRGIDMDKYKNENTPLINALNNHISKDRINMHMPGHKQGVGFNHTFQDNVLNYDLTELPGLDNLHNPTDAIFNSMELCSQAFGALKSYFLVNGSTSGIHACFLSCFRKGDKVLLNRNCHISVINALILYGVEPIFVMPEYNNEYNLPIPASFDMWKSALYSNPDVKGAFVTTPDYYGICQPIAELSTLLHDAGKILLVDEAHGTHFAFSNLLPKTALEQGADICVQSFHKTLPAVTQSAVLHIGSERVDDKKVQQAISMITTTSPSYIIMSSMDYARDLAKTNGAVQYDKLLSKLDEQKRKLMAMESLRIVPDIVNDFKRDPTRIVIDTSLADITGLELYERLYDQYGIVAEMCDTYHVVLILTMADVLDDIERIGNALIKIDKSVIKLGTRTFFNNSLYTRSNNKKYSVPDLYNYLSSSRQMAIEDAEGCVSAGLVTPYPPGIPLLCPGETITDEDIQQLKKLLKAGFDVHGLLVDEDGTILVKII